MSKASFKEAQRQQMQHLGFDIDAALQQFSQENEQIEEAKFAMSAGDQI